MLRATSLTTAAITGGTITGTNVPYILAQSFAAVSAPSDTTEDVLATITIPANALGANGKLRITSFWTVTNSANAKTARHRFNGIGGTAYNSFSVTAVATVAAYTEIANRGATNSQFGTLGTAAAGFGTSTSSFLTSAADTTAATTLVITGQKATAGEVLTLEGYTVEVLFKA